MSHSRLPSVLGLGYVGLPVACALARVGCPVIGFDIDERRVADLRAGIDRTGEIGAADLGHASLQLTTDPADLARADFHIVTVPTPIDDARRPDLGPLERASTTLGRQLKRRDIVVFESTVYPGATEEVCVPILERESGLRFGRDFSVGYSPERINPGDRTHRFETITKVVAASDPAALETVAAVYASVVEAGLHRAPDIRTAEAAKVIENTQRDLNIALMNELAVIFDRLGLDTRDVLAAAGTKWNFLPFTPGLVGGHCIGVDPYYLTHRAERAGYHPEVILAGRRINDGMGGFVARETAKRLMRRTGGHEPLRVTILGATFKENVADMRNSRVVDVVTELKTFGIAVQLTDPLADPAAVEADFGVPLTSVDALLPADAVILAVAHQAYVDGGWSLVRDCLRGGQGVVSDVRGCLDRSIRPAGIELWRL